MASVSARAPQDPIDRRPRVSHLSDLNAAGGDSNGNSDDSNSNNSNNSNSNNSSNNSNSNGSICIARPNNVHQTSSTISSTNYFVVSPVAHTHIQHHTSTHLFVGSPCNSSSYNGSNNSNNNNNRSDHRNSDSSSDKKSGDQTKSVIHFVGSPVADTSGKQPPANKCFVGSPTNAATDSRSNSSSSNGGSNNNNNNNNNNNKNKCISDGINGSNSNNNQTTSTPYFVGSPLARASQQTPFWDTELIKSEATTEDTDDIDAEEEHCVVPASRAKARSAEMFEDPIVDVIIDAARTVADRELTKSKGESKEESSKESSKGEEDKGEEEEESKQEESKGKEDSKGKEERQTDQPTHQEAKPAEEVEIESVEGVPGERAGRAKAFGGEEEEEEDEEEEEEAKAAAKSAEEAAAKTAEKAAAAKTAEKAAAAKTAEKAAAKTAEEAAAKTAEKAATEEEKKDVQRVVCAGDVVVVDDEDEEEGVVEAAGGDEEDKDEEEEEEEEAEGDKQEDEAAEGDSAGATTNKTTQDGDQQEVQENEEEEEEEEEDADKYSQIAVKDKSRPRKEGPSTARATAKPSVDGGKVHKTRRIQQPMTPWGGDGRMLGATAGPSISSFMGSLLPTSVGEMLRRKVDFLELDDEIPISAVSASWSWTFVRSSDGVMCARAALHFDANNRHGARTWDRSAQGAIVVAIRGRVNFDKMARRAEAAGAVALVVVNNHSKWDESFEMGCDSVGFAGIYYGAPKIPAILVPKSAKELLTESSLERQLRGKIVRR